MVSKEMKGGIADSEMVYSSMGDLEKRMKKRRSPLNFLERRRAANREEKDRLRSENVEYGETTSYRPKVVATMEKAKEEMERLKQEQLVRAHKRLKSDRAGGLQNVYNYPFEPEGPRQLHQLPLSDLEDDIMKVRDKNCNNAINATCRMNCNRLTGTQPKCLKCVEDNISNIKTKCKGDPLDDRENFPEELLLRLEKATPERKDNVKLRSEQDGEKQIINTIKRAPEDRNIMKMFSRSRNRAKQERLKREQVAALGPHGVGGARRRRRTKRRKPMKSKKSKRTRRTRRQRR
jgi:hypothetical protein